ncbi:MAG: hypothetical protein ACRD3O_00015 [Terriglobia bacterium]
MALPSLVTQEAAAAVTAPVSAFPDVNHISPETPEQMFLRLVQAGWPGDLAAYAIEGDEPWAARHNADCWRSDATGCF